MVQARKDVFVVTADGQDVIIQVEKEGRGGGPFRRKYENHNRFRGVIR